MPQSPDGAGPARVLLLTKYGRRAAATRFRVLQYLPYFEAAGLAVDIRPLLDDRYLEKRLVEGRRAPFHALRGIGGRLRTFNDVRQFALVVIYMEALPYLPAFFERALVRLGIPYVYDFDDATFHQYDQHTNPLVRALLSKKIGAIISGASLVMAGNAYLADYARRFNTSVEVVPTVVDVDKFLPAPAHAAGGPAVIGWIGSPSTAQYINERQALWERATADGQSTLRLVGAGPSAVRAPWVEHRAWREDTETDEVRQFDVGIMPLRDDPWSRGKCGFKLIQYLSCGVPAVASPVGVNSQIVVQGENGFLCRSDAEWETALGRLVHEPALRQELGARGRELVRQHWSLQRWGPDVAALLARAAGVVGKAA